MLRELGPYLGITGKYLPKRQPVEAAAPLTDYDAYPNLKRYPQAVNYLQSLGVTAADIAAIYPHYEEFVESEYDTHGSVFRYFGNDRDETRLDRVMFTSPTYHPYMLAVDRQDRHIAQSPYTFGVRVLPTRRIRLNVYPDQTAALILQRSTQADLIDMATYFIDAEGKVTTGELAMMNSQYLNPQRGFTQKFIPRSLDSVSDAAAQKIMYFSEQFLEEGWELTERDIAIPSGELTRRILTAPVDKGVNLKEMLTIQ